MRIISGKYRGKRLFSPADKNVRPTSDRVKESIFNILLSKGAIPVTNVLDLFSGSGAMGIEALSRGCTAAVFVDKAISLTQKNIQHCGALHHSQAFQTDYTIALKKLKEKKFDLIFCDPPYILNARQILEDILQSGILDEKGQIVFEHSTKNDLQIALLGYIIDTRIFGHTCVSFICKELGGAD